MAAFVRAPGSVSSKVNGTTLSTAVGVAGHAAGNMLVVITAFDNLSATTPTVTFSDSQGNTYTTIAQGATNATAAGGVGGAIGISYLTTALASGDTVTATYSGSITTKALTLAEFSGTLDVERVADVIASGAGTALTVTSGSASAGDLVIGGMMAELDSSPSADTDTTNGSWNAIGAIASTGGNQFSNIGLRAQYKIVTAAGTQTYDGTVGTSTDWIAIAAVLATGTKRTASASGAGTQSATGNKVINTVTRTASGSGTGTSTAAIPPVSVTDDFTRADSTTLVGGTWTQNGVLGITSNAAYMVSGTAGSAVQPIQSSAFDQVVRMRVQASASVNTAIRLIIAYQDANNYVALSRAQPFATWALISVVAGTQTQHGNTGLSAVDSVWVTIVRDGSTFYASAQASSAGSTQSRSATFTISGMSYNGVGFSFDTAGTGYTIDDFSARPLVVVTRTATGSGSGTQTAARLVTRPRTATGTGTGSATTQSLRTVIRTASGSGTGTQTATRLISQRRTATAAGAGSSSSTGLHTAPRTGSASGTGTATTQSIRIVQRTATGSGAGSATVTTSTSTTVSRTATASGVGTATVAATVIAVQRRTATGTGTGTSTANGSIAAIVQRTASSAGTSTQVANRQVEPHRTASSTGTGSQTCVGSKPAGTQRQASGFGTGSSSSTIRRYHYRTATSTGSSSSITVSSSTERPYPPSAPRNQGKVRSRQTNIVIAERPVIRMTLPPERVQSTPQLVFDYFGDDEVMLCLA